MLARDVQQALDGQRRQFEKVAEKVRAVAVKMVGEEGV
jgi:hypothetical protein